MSYTSPLFVFFVSFSVLGQMLLPLRLRLLWTIIMSLLWFASWHPFLPVFLVILVIVDDYLIGKKLPTLMVLTNLTCLILLRTTAFLPSLGSSFYLLTLTAISLGNLRSRLTFRETLCISTFFPLMMAGPVMREMPSPDVSRKKILDGFLIFASGLLKYHFLVLPLTGMNEAFDSFLWQGFILTVQIYLTLSSFSDAGRGVALMLGFEVPPAFRPVIYAKNPSDFWSRWNWTVAGWFRDFCLLPALLRWGRTVPRPLILLLGFILLGLWHGLEIHWIIFGIFNALMILLWNRFQFAGRMLAILTLFGNGYIQLMGLTKSADPVWLRELLRQNWWQEFGPGFIPAILVFLIYEFFQERFSQNDFFLRLSVKWKTALAIFLLIFWLWATDFPVPQAPDLLPLYFTL